jgi:hypothetical protein
MTRRRALLLLALAVAGLLTIGLQRHLARLKSAVARRLRPRLDASAPTGTLSDRERDTILAFGEVLAADRPLSPVERRSYGEQIDEQTLSTPGRAALYRSVAGLLDRLAGASFSGLDIRDRAAMVARHNLAAYRVSTTEYLLPFRRQELTVRVLAVPELIAGYYRCAAGWAVVGYAAYPGRCGDPRRYTRAEA